jgi:hypothetical protein
MGSLNAGSTPLHWAVHWSQADIVAQLCRGGAKEIPDSVGKLPIDYCRQSEIRRLLNDPVATAAAAVRTAVVFLCWF